MLDKVVIAKVNYFIDYWQDFLYFGSIEEELTHIIVYNPNELFKEFADEISRKKLSNKDNKKFFLDSINKFINLEIESIKHLESILIITKMQFNKPNFPYLLHLLTILDKELSDNRLGLNCIEELEKILTNSNVLDDNI